MLTKELGEKKTEAIEIFIREISKSEVAGFNAGFYTKRINDYKNELQQLEKQLYVARSTSEVRKLKIQIKRAKSHVKSWEKKLEFALNKLKKIRTLVSKYKYLSENIRFDRNVVNSNGSPWFFNTLDGSIEKLSMEKDIEKQLYYALKLLNKDFEIIEKKEQKAIKEMKKLGKKIIQELSSLTPKQGKTIWYNHEEFIYGCFHFGEVVQLIPPYQLLDTILYKRSLHFCESVTLDNNVSVSLNDLMDKERCYSKIVKIQQIEKIIKEGKHRGSYLNNSQLKKLNESLKLYKEYAVHFIAYKVIEYHLNSGKLRDDSKEFSELKAQLSKIVEKEKEYCENLKSKANNLYLEVLYTSKDKETEIIDSYETEEPVVEKTVTHKEIPVAEENVTKDVPQPVNPEVEEKKEEPIEEKKLDEHELKSLSSGYRSGYIQEKIKGTDLGKLSYSEYLKNIVPEQKELISYIQKEESRARSVYGDYVRDVMYRRSNNYTIIPFRAFVERKLGEFDLEITPDIEKGLEELKTL